MKKTAVAAIACLSLLPAAAQDNPFAGMKNKMKEGAWETTMQMGPMPGMPAGMTMPPMTHTQCVTAKDIESGGVGSKGGKMPDGCTVSNMKMSGDSVSYSMECTKSPKMKGDVSMTFSGDSYTMKQDMVMDHGGQMVPMKNTINGKYKGPCK